MRELRPVHLKPGIIRENARRLLEYLWRVLYQPIFEILRDRTNSRANESQKTSNLDSLGDLLLKYLGEDRIHIHYSHIVGKFDAQLAKLLESHGAQYNKYFRAYFLRPLPDKVIEWLGIQKEAVEETSQRILEFLGAVDYSRAKPLDISPGRLLDDVDRQINDIGLKIKPSEELKQSLSKNYTENTNLFIRHWLDDEVIKMRRQLQTLIFEEGATMKDLERFFYRPEKYRVGREGKIPSSKFYRWAIHGDGELRHRFPRDPEKFVAKHGIGDIPSDAFHKAAFLARQESSLLLNSYANAQYQEAGIRRFRWSTANDWRVRDSHRELQGKIFEFANPPLITGNKRLPDPNFRPLRWYQWADPRKRTRETVPMLPGMDYSCRCVAIAILD
jgi:SPP1 gp7 family putative phage head morphogenesis protein